MPARSKARALLGVALLLAALLHTWRFRHHLTDDAFISFRYLANFFAGHGLVYNPGERVWGYTNFLWTVLLAPLVAAGADPVVYAQALGLTASFLLLALVLAGGTAGRPSARSWNPAGA